MDLLILFPVGVMLFNLQINICIFESSSQEACAKYLLSLFLLHVYFWKHSGEIHNAYLWMFT